MKNEPRSQLEEKATVQTLGGQAKVDTTLNRDVEVTNLSVSAEMVPEPKCLNGQGAPLSQENAYDDDMEMNLSDDGFSLNSKLHPNITRQVQGPLRGNVTISNKKI